MTLFDNIKKLGLRAASRYLKPLLTDDNKKARLEWALRWVSSSPGHRHKIHHFEDFVHMDEKWFYICQNGHRSTTCTPTRSCQPVKFNTNRTLPPSPCVRECFWNHMGTPETACTMTAQT